jgi:hypothetical protein
MGLSCGFLVLYSHPALTSSAVLHILFLYMFSVVASFSFRRVVVTSIRVDEADPFTLSVLPLIDINVQNSWNVNWVRCGCTSYIQYSHDKRELQTVSRTFEFPTKISVVSHSSTP